MTKITLQIDLLNAKMGYILACLASYSSLDLSKRLKNINDKIYLISKSISTDTVYIDIRDVIELKTVLKDIQGRLPNNDEVLPEGHKIACLLFEFSTLCKQVILDMSEEKVNEDYIEYLSYVAQIAYACARLVNIEILCFENKLL